MKGRDALANPGVDESKALVRILQERSSCGLVGNLRFPRHQKSEISGDDISTAAASKASGEERSERAVDRRETAIRSNGDRREP